MTSVLQQATNMPEPVRAAPGSMYQHERRHAASAPQVRRSSGCVLAMTLVYTIAVHPLAAGRSLRGDRRTGPDRTRRSTVPRASAEDRLRASRRRPTIDRF